MFLALRALPSHNIHFFLDNKELFTNHDPTHNSEAGKVTGGLCYMLAGATTE